MKALNLEPAGVEVKTDFGNNEKEFNFDQWQREKTLDRMRVIKYPKLNGVAEKVGSNIRYPIEY